MIKCAIRAAAIVLVLPGTVAARELPLKAELPPDRKACWERTYDAAHLAAHPRQQVKRIRLIHSPGDWLREDGRLGVDLQVNVRGPRTGPNAMDYSVFGFCRSSRGGLSCRPEWNAGAWRIERGQGGSLVVRNESSIAFNPDGYAAEEVSENAVRIRAEPDDKAWRLFRANDAACRG
jgi:hypothetical protein